MSRRETHPLQRVLGDQTGASLIEVVLVVAVIAILAWFLLDRFGTDGTGESTAGPPDMISSMDHTRQRQTLSDMKLIARANDIRMAETGRYAERLSDLAAVGQRLDIDAWGTPYDYEPDGSSYTLISLGSDQAPGPKPPRPWKGSPYEPDVVMVNGRFEQAPDGR